MADIARARYLGTVSLGISQTAEPSPLVGDAHIGPPVGRPAVLGIGGVGCVDPNAVRIVAMENVFVRSAPFIGGILLRDLQDVRPPVLYWLPTHR